MLIDFSFLEIKKPVKGVIHIGAHECEELEGYVRNYKLTNEKIIWIEALEEIVTKVKSKDNSIKIYNECISDIDDNEVSFMVANNFQSSSMLDFKTHLEEHPHVFETKRVMLKTKTLKTFYNENNLNPDDYNFINLDIQGAELMALKGAGDILHNIDYIYCEVNSKELYKGCCLLDELESYLSTFGFKRTLISMTQHGWGDAWYTKS